MGPARDRSLPSDTMPISPEQRAELERLIAHAAHYLPAQGPIDVFIHHNTLHAFEEEPFEEAVVHAARIFGTEPFLPESRYRAELARGRIREADIDAVLDREGQQRDGTMLAGGRVSLRDLQRVLLLHPVRQESDAAVHPARSDLSSLRILGSVGEPINPEAWMWYYKHVGGERCPIVDTFWQTETGGHMITPLPGATPLVPGSCTLPLPGIMAAIVDEVGNPIPNGTGGILVVKRPWPSMIRTIWNDPERFKKSYFPEEMGGTMYLAGDGAVRSADRGYFRITGRIDDVLNVSGHRMGTMEIESALVSKT
ncbi:MAG: DUF2309 family protein, partial [Planctomycetia bacterium]|nr:DUF2309 family protein [Planctomycetia bacterium]